VSDVMGKCETRNEEGEEGIRILNRKFFYKEGGSSRQGGRQENSKRIKENKGGRIEKRKERK